MTERERIQKMGLLCDFDTSEKTTEALEDRIVYTSHPEFCGEDVNSVTLTGDIVTA